MQMRSASPGRVAGFDSRRIQFFCNLEVAATNAAVKTETMKTLALLLTLLTGNLSAVAAEQPAPPIVELPRPNSGTFTFAEAEARKLEILSNVPTSKLENWKNPYMGFCIHIGKDDSLIVYGHFMKEFTGVKITRSRSVEIRREFSLPLICP
jgi:hypothetical protein